mgnify:CR=1 FL=1
MTWDPRDTKLVVHDASAGVPLSEPAGPAMVPTLAVLHGLDDWLDEGFTLDNLSAAEEEDARLAGLVPESQWAARRRLMTRGIVETS